MLSNPHTVPGKSLVRFLINLPGPTPQHAVPGPRDTEWPSPAQSSQGYREKASVYLEAVYVTILLQGGGPEE